MSDLLITKFKWNFEVIAVEGEDGLTHYIVRLEIYGEPGDKLLHKDTYNFGRRMPTDFELSSMVYNARRAVVNVKR